MYFALASTVSTVNIPISKYILKGSCTRKLFVALSMYILLVSMKKKTYQPKLSQKVNIFIFKIRYNVGMAAPGHVAEDSTAH